MMHGESTPVCLHHACYQGTCQGVIGAVGSLGIVETTSPTCSLSAVRSNGLQGMSCHRGISSQFSLFRLRGMKSELTKDGGFAGIVQTQDQYSGLPVSENGHQSRYPDAHAVKTLRALRQWAAVPCPGLSPLRHGLWLPCGQSNSTILFCTASLTAEVSCCPPTASAAPSVLCSQQAKDDHSRRLC